VALGQGGARLGVAVYLGSGRLGVALGNGRERGFRLTELGR
jgi:hypothetical protein